MHSISVKGLHALCVALLAFVLACPSRAQPHTNVVFPADGQSDVAVDASVVIRGTHPIVPPTVTHRWPNEETMGWRANEPTVLLIAETHVTRLPRERWSRQAIAGTYTFDDLRTLRFTPRVPLRKDVTYRCVVDGVMMNVGTGVVRASPHSFTFTTTDGVPIIAASTLDSVSVVGCTQPIYVKFSTIDAYTLNDAASRVRITTHSDIAASDVPVPINVVVHNLSRSIEILPLGSWPTQRALSVKLPWGDVTGDPRNSKTWGMVSRGASSLQVTAEAIDGRELPGEVTDFFARQSQVVLQDVRSTVTTPLWFSDRWRFVRWESTDIVSANEVTSLSLDVTMPCDLLTSRLHLKAIVARIDTMHVVVDIDSGGSVTMRDHENNVMSELSTSDTVSITDSTPWFTLTASPAAGNVFAGWQASTSLWNQALASNAIGTTGATIVVSPQAFVAVPIGGGPLTGSNPPTGGNPPTGAGGVLVPMNSMFAHFHPGFLPNINVSALEMFELQASIVDESPEPGHSVDEGAVFTTPSWFTSALQEERTPCIRTEPCWEVVSVNDAEDGAGNREFAPGTDQACETALLTNPPNSVTFSVRRRRMQLRVERVLISSDNADDVIAGRKLHPESFVIVELQQGAEGAHFWRPLSAANCSTSDDIEYSNYEVRCGDVVRIRTRGSAARGETWKFFANRQGYALPGEREEYLDETRYILAVDRNLAQFDATDCAGTDLEKPEIRLRACFRQQFGIDALGLRVRTMGNGSKVTSTFREVWIDPLVYYDPTDGEPKDGRQLEYIPFYGTPIRVRFTTPLDVESVLAGGMKASSYGNVNVNSTLADNLDFSVNSFDDEHISFGPVDGSPIDLVEFRVCDPTTSPRKQALHFGNISLFCGKSLTSATGEPLRTRFSFLLHSMERAGYGLFLERAKWSHDGDDDFWPFTNYAELYNVLYGAVLTPADAQYSEIGFQRLPDCSEQQGVPPSECVYEYSEDNGYFGFSSRTLLFEPSWLGDRDYVFSHIASYDEDCKDEGDCLVNKVDALLDAVREKATDYQPTDEEKSEGITWETVIPDLIDLGTQFIQALLPMDDQDEFIGQMTLLNSSSELWGAAESTAPYIIRYHDNGEYVYKARLFPRRQVRF